MSAQAVVQPNHDPIAVLQHIAVFCVELRGHDLAAGMRAMATRWRPVPAAGRRCWCLTRRCSHSFQAQRSTANAAIGCERR